VTAREAHFQPMDLVPEAEIDRKRAMLETPALIKAYLRLGGVVGQGAWVDHAFNTTDVCLIMDTAQLNARQRQIYTRQMSTGQMSTGQMSSGQAEARGS